MSVQETKFLDIANAIREKDGTTAPIIANDFAARIRAIKTMPDGLHTIALSANDNALGTVTGGGIVQKNMVVTVSAAPAQSNYQFTHWKENDIDVSQEEEYSFLVEGDRNLEAVFIIGKPSRLPEGYTEVEYIQNANTSSYFSVSKAFYDDSTNGAAFEIVFALPTLQSSKYIFSAKNFRFQAYSASKGTLQLYINNSSAGAYKTLTAKIAANQKSTLTIRNKIATLNGVSDTLSYYAAGGSPLLIPYSTQSYCATAKYYYIKGTRSSTTSSTFNFEFIPCINPSGIVGFYDLVSTTFIKPTAGTFIAGPAV